MSARSASASDRTRTSSSSPERVATTGDRRLVTLAMGGETVVVDSPGDRWLPDVGDVADVDVRGGFVADPVGTILTRVD